jgi:hypothetical protein
MKRLTIFSAPKPFTNPHIATIQRNAIRSWQAMGEGVVVVLVGNEEGMAQAAAELGVQHLPQVRCNTQGTPLVSSIFELARQANDAPLLVYVNADILLLPEFLEQAEQTARQVEKFLLVGQRWDLDVTQPLDFSPSWEQRLRQTCAQQGKLHPRGGSDYFLFPRACFNDVPDFAIGRAGWDNWMIYAARDRGWAVVDGSGVVQVIHQSHDYSHLPNGKPHYRLPESFENVRLGGGRRTIFTLADADYFIRGEQVQHLPIRGQKFWREAEIFPLVKLHSYPLAQLAYAVFHPLKAYREFRAWLAQKRARPEEKG